MDRIRWYLKRLRVMSPLEVAYRVNELATLQRLRIRALAAPPAVSSEEWRKVEFCISATARLPFLPFVFDAAPEERVRQLDGHWPALGFDWKWSPDPDVWHIAPDSGKRWPTTFFGSIQYRPGNPVGDARVVWEPARLQQLISLALLGQTNPSDWAMACRLMEDILDSWLGGNPYLKGIHYVSAMECALRLMAVCHAFDMVRGQILDPDRTWRNVLSLVKGHAALISKRLSLHSSAGNHTIAEATGLVYAGVLFPELAGAEDWKATGMRVLQQESQRQVLADGGGIEQAFWYHLFNIDLLGLAGRLLVFRQIPLPTEIEGAVARGKRFLSEIVRDLGTMPAVGDSDDGYALSKHLHISFDAPTGKVAPSECFPDAGYTLLRSETQPSVQVLIDHGPLGMQPSYGHGHADALSVLAWVGGREVFAETGTFGYGLSEDWRRFFRSTRAHNTVIVANEDQARQESAFMWSAPYHAEVVKRGQVDPNVAGSVLMRHDGYARFGVTHWRGVSLSDRGVLVIWDWITGVGSNEVELNWHLAMEPEDSDLSRGVVKLPIGVNVMVRGGKSSIVRGGLEPMNGWRSSLYGRRGAIPTISVCHAGELPHEFVTVVSLGESPEDAEAEVRMFREWSKWAQAA
ncbi:MAG: hypothetical protein NFCOHLIN_02955 [Gammaproteobacteria bacterium]|nr:hypothetical protein [Gammaproteobacteria bacterium]